jgi:RimJ/RimL family protein N-acetyltransferase
MAQRHTARVTLVPVDDVVLEDLVRAATTGASADEVTPPLTPGGTWTIARTDWLRRFHADRRDGLGGRCEEATWAVVADGSVVGSVRLRRASSEGVLETGAWLTRAARGRGVGRAALTAVLGEATAAGGRRVQACTTADNGAALAVLQRLGFACTPQADGRAVRALLLLEREDQGSESQARPSPSPSSRATSP